MLIVSGMVVGFCFDFYRMVRWRLGLNKVLTFMGDLLFSLSALLIVFVFAQKANYLEFRFYLFLGSLVGLLLYLQLLSCVVKKVIDAVLIMITELLKFLLGLIAAFFNSSFASLTALMSIPYGLLRWVSMLFYRFGEALGRESAGWVKTKIPRSPK